LPFVGEYLVNSLSERISQAVSQCQTGVAPPVFEEADHEPGDPDAVRQMLLGPPILQTESANHVLHVTTSRSAESVGVTSSGFFFPSASISGDAGGFP
jgi:hypothetical protein